MIQLTERQLARCKIILSLDIDKIPSTNYYFTQISSHELDNIPDNIIQKYILENNIILYRLTKKGVELVMNKKITNEEYNSLLSINKVFNESKAIK